MALLHGFTAKNFTAKNFTAKTQRAQRREEEKKRRRGEESEIRVLFLCPFFSLALALFASLR
jgi:hypothetical protein